MKILSRGDNKNLIILIFSIGYATLLCSLPMELFDDRDYYLLYASDSWIILNEYLENSYLKLLANEPVWLILNSILALFFSPINVVKIIIFASSLLFAGIFLKLSGKNYLYAFPLLFLPNILVNFTVHLRQGLGEALFLSFFLFRNNYIKNILWLLALQIHTSFIFLIGIFGFQNQINKKKYSIFALIFLATILSFIIIYSTEFAAYFLGSRQVEEVKFWSKPSSGAGFIFFTFILIIFIKSGTNFIYKNYYSIILLIFYISGYFNFYWASRIFESSFPIIVLSGFNLKNYYRIMFLLMISFYWIYGSIETVQKFL